MPPCLHGQVGIFRRGKYAGGKRVGKGDAVNEGDGVKKGQVLGYVEQLGTHFAIEVRESRLYGNVVSKGLPVPLP